MGKTDNNAAEETLQQKAAEAAMDETTASEENAMQDDPEVLATEKLKQELGEMKDKYLRLAAEFDNYRRRTAQEMLEIRQTATRELTVSLLDVLDDCDRADQVLTSDQDPEVMKEGVKLVFQKLRSTLEGKGLKEMQANGKDFNADLHEAIAEVPAPTPELAGKVLDQVQKGYTLNDRIIRFAKVVVGK